MALCLQPLLQAEVVDKLHTSPALASGQQWVLHCRLVDPTEAAEGQILVYALLLLLYLRMVVGVQLCDRLLIQLPQGLL